MESKRIIWLFAILGGWIGGYIPLLWGVEHFSFSIILFHTVGAIIGIWIGFKLGD